MYRVSSSWKLFMTLPSLCSSSSYILSRICSIPGTHKLPGHLAFGNSSSIGNPEKGSWKSPPLQELVDCQAANR
uniref:Uncharacterized protein n=1 Tax=Oryza barthii TaxID=65489 RepID=A0A0D3EK86_9ORYZ